MLTLFNVEPEMPEGFKYYPDFITTEEESKLIAFIQSMELNPMQFHQYEAKRKVKSFGRSWSFTEQRLKQNDPIPNEFSFLIDRITKQINISKEEIVQLLVTEYPVGSVINWHRDAPPFAIIAGISLQSDCTLKLRPHDVEKQKKESTLKLNVQRRSLYVMQGKAKTDWQHSTALLKHVRYSLTFRTVR